MDTMTSLQVSMCTSHCLPQTQHPTPKQNNLHATIHAPPFCFVDRTFFSCPLLLLGVVFVVVVLPSPPPPLAATHKRGGQKGKEKVHATNNGTFHTFNKHKQVSTLICLLLQRTKSLPTLSTPLSTSNNFPLIPNEHFSSKHNVESHTS